jgi:uncharacterized protein (TIGR02145 family)
MNICSDFKRIYGFSAMLLSLSVFACGDKPAKKQEDSEIKEQRVEQTQEAEPMKEQPQEQQTSQEVEQKIKIVYGKPVAYGGETYKTVVIGEQTWLTRNLNYKPSQNKSWCYDDESSNCAKYGRLYDWVTAMALPSYCYKKTCASQIKPKHQGICPKGYHIPTKVDWEKLVSYAGGENVAGGKLKAANGWDGEDVFGFLALPGGSFNRHSGNFSQAGNFGLWWGTDEGEWRKDEADSFMMSYIEENVFINGTVDKSAGLSVRCVED